MLSAKRYRSVTVTIDDLKAEWERMLALLEQQRELLEVQGIWEPGPRFFVGSTTQDSLARIRKCISELEALLAAYSDHA